MGVLDKFLDIMKLSDDEDDYDDFMRLLRVRREIHVQAAR